MTNDSLDLIDRVLEDYTNSRDIQNQLLDLVQSLHQDLEAERNSTAMLQETVLKLTNQETFGVTSKYLSLKADHSALRGKLLSLQDEYDDLNIQIISKNEETKQLLSKKEEEMQCYYNTLLKSKDESLRAAEQEIGTWKRGLHESEAKHHNEIRMVEAATNAKLNQMESDFHKKCHESNKKLKENMDTCTVLRMELMSVKEQFAEYKRSSIEKIEFLQKRLRETSALNRDASSDRLSDADTPKLDDQVSKYRPLNMSCQKKEEPINLKRGPLPSKPAPKKRRLFNPDDLSYLGQ